MPAIKEIAVPNNVDNSLFNAKQLNICVPLQQLFIFGKKLS
jgi:hypothetical protein